MVTEIEDSTNNSIAFVMPEGYTLENTPKPNDQRVKIKQISERYVAALKFSGRWTNSNFDEKSKELITKLQKANIKTKGNIFSMRYSSPYTPWFLRRNEVAIEIHYE
ncbi:MAG: heme-binding protein [Candidatus Bathyarchaeota archaeon]